MKDTNIKTLLINTVPLCLNHWREVRNSPIISLGLKDRQKEECFICHTITEDGIYIKMKENKGL